MKRNELVRLSLAGVLPLLIALGIAGCDVMPIFDADRGTLYPNLVTPDGFHVEKVASGLHLPTGLTWDDDGPAGSQVFRVNPATGVPEPFLRNKQPGPASTQGLAGRGLDRPFNVRFGPDGAMYVVDYGVVTIDMSMKSPYVYREDTGVIWKVTRVAE